MASSGELLVELRCDELPPALIELVANELTERFLEALESHGFESGPCQTEATLRRVVLQLEASRRPLAEGEEETVIGPPASAAFDAGGEATPRLLRFLEAHGATIDEVERMPRGRGAVAVLRRQRPPPDAAHVVGEALSQAVESCRWPQTMRWSEEGSDWVRPLRGLMALYDGKPVPCRVLGTSAQGTTIPHPVLARSPISVRDAADYRRKLSARGVELDFGRRRELLAERLASRARELGGQIVSRPELVSRLACSCEIAGVVDGRIELEFLSLPRELIVASLSDRLQAFAVESGGSLLPFFLVVVDRPDDPAGHVRTGHESAVASVLGDVRFLYDRDRQVPLAQRYRRLAELSDPLAPGSVPASYADKVRRIDALADTLCRELGCEREREAVAEAIRLVKADLTTRLVREFPRLQGVIGGVLARDEGYPETIWQAIYDHIDSGDGVPRGAVGQLVALAERIDSLVGLVASVPVADGREGAAGVEAGRPLATSLVRILLGGNFDLDLDLAAARAVRLYGERLPSDGEDVVGRLRPLIDESVRSVLLDEGFRRDEIEAVLAAGETPSLPALLARAKGIHALRDDERLPGVVRTARRIVEILKEAPEHPLDPALLIEDAEKDLFVVYQRVRAEISGRLVGGQYEAWLRSLADLGNAIDRFLAEVLIRDEDVRLRQNRLGLLQSVHRLVSRSVRLAELELGERSARSTARPEGGAD